MFSILRWLVSFSLVLPVFAGIALHKPSWHPGEEIVILVRESTSWQQDCLTKVTQEISGFANIRFKLLFWIDPDNRPPYQVELEAKQHEEPRTGTAGFSEMGNRIWKKEKMMIHFSKPILDKSGKKVVGCSQDDYRVMRHEFGHLLGLHHEFNHPELSDEFRSLIESVHKKINLDASLPSPHRYQFESYDSQSVMHYYVTLGWDELLVLFKNGTLESELGVHNSLLIPQEKAGLLLRWDVYKAGRSQTKILREGEGKKATFLYHTEFSEGDRKLLQKLYPF